MNAIKIYTVDDYLLTRIGHKKYFEDDERFEITGDFASARECLLALEKSQPDVILMDIELPNMTGIEATRIIKDKYPKVKVIILTSFENEEHILLALASGACGYVLKNNQKINLKEVIKTVMNGVFWMDLKNAKAAFSKLSVSNLEDLTNLYEDKELINTLTQRELEVLKLMIEGKTNSQIAREIVVSTNTAKAHVGSILSKLAAKDRVQAVVKAVRTNLF